MKKIFKIIFTALIIFLFSFSVVTGQEKQNEQKIKIIIEDCSGTKVVIDTLVKDGMSTDSIKLKDGKVIYINESWSPDKEIEKEIEKTFDVYVSSDDKDSDVEMTRYVIAKDGMVVTVEGRDEAKAKELIKEIKDKMGVKGDEDVTKETVKAETKYHRRNR